MYWLLLAWAGHINFVNFVQTIEWPAAEWWGYAWNLHLESHVYDLTSTDDKQKIRNRGVFISFLFALKCKGNSGNFTPAYRLSFKKPVISDRCIQVYCWRNCIAFWGVFPLKGFWIKTSDGLPLSLEKSYQRPRNISLLYDMMPLSPDNSFEKYVLLTCCHREAETWWIDNWYIETRGIMVLW